MVSKLYFVHFPDSGQTNYCGSHFKVTFQQLLRLTLEMTKRPEYQVEPECGGLLCGKQEGTTFTEYLLCCRHLTGHVIHSFAYSFQ